MLSVINVTLGNSHERDIRSSGGQDMEVRATPDAAGFSEELSVLERAHYLSAAERARQVYPGALGELLHRELTAFAEFGYRLAVDGFIPRLAVEVLSDVQDGDDRMTRSPEPGAGS